MVRPHRTTRAGLWIFVLSFVGLLFVQTAWTLVVPAFRGLDEQDHVYRASSVAEGNWRPGHRTAENGRGDLIQVRADIVATSKPVCESLDAGHDNCNPVANGSGDTVLVASAAARYHPVFYAAIGTVAKPFHGYSAVYAMRAVAMVLCAGLCGLAVVVARRFATTRWPMVAVLVTATPMVTYSTTIAAPNGVELCSALLLWSVLLSLPRPEVHLRQGTRLILLATVAAVVLATVRSIGPLWLALILVTCAVVLGRTGLEWLLSRYRQQLLVAVAVVSVAGILAVGWTLAAQPNAPSSEVPDDDPASLGKILPFFLPYWVLQSIGVFPARNELAPMPVYATFVVLYLGLLALAWRSTRGRTRAALVMIIAVSAVLPLMLTVLTWNELGLAWQGRYGVPYAMGAFLIAGQALDRRPPKWAALSAPSALVAVVVASAIACAIAQIGARNVIVEGYDYAFWTAPPAWGTALLTGVGFVLIGAAGLVSADRSERHDPDGLLPVVSQPEVQSGS